MPKLAGKQAESTTLNTCYLMAKSKKEKSRSHLTKADLRLTIETYLSNRPGEYFALRTLFKSLKLNTHPLKMLCIDVLNEMLANDEIVRNEDGDISYNGQSDKDSVYPELGRSFNGKQYRNRYSCNPFFPGQGQCFWNRQSIR